MEYQYKYNGLIERQAWIAEAEGKGLRMLHDTFDDPNWKRGDPQIGTMIFTNEPEPQSEPVRDLTKERMDALESRIASLEAKE